MANDKVYSDSETIARLATDLPQWEAGDGTISRTYRTPGWPHTLMLVNAIAHAAEAAWHHPDLQVGYNAVHITLSTHSAKGVTDKDLALARRIEAIATWQPASDSPLEGFEIANGKKWIG